ncbi:hypothetical protein SDC9_153458 [bioreactor metagenome]|uniref:Uncharacterized protein n=1 Tax=bioreactor metagenome TaxID=1076179 RepID=A0A645EY76_9ZZZZ
MDHRIVQPRREPVRGGPGGKPLRHGVLRLGRKRGEFAEPGKLPVSVEAGTAVDAEAAGTVDPVFRREQPDGKLVFSVHRLRGGDGDQAVFIGDAGFQRNFVDLFPVPEHFAGGGKTAEIDSKLLADQ